MTCDTKFSLLQSTRHGLTILRTDFLCTVAYHFIMLFYWVSI